MIRGRITLGHKRETTALFAFLKPPIPTSTLRGVELIQQAKQARGTEREGGTECSKLSTFFGPKKIYRQVQNKAK